MANEKKMFGCMVEDLIADFRLDENTPYEQLMSAISRLSDAQELVHADMKEEARQTINQAKFIIQHVREGMLR
jgi:hypothetical protein